jgi:hypothetical protein
MTDCFRVFDPFLAPAQVFYA